VYEQRDFGANCPHTLDLSKGKTGRLLVGVRMLASGHSIAFPAIVAQIACTSPKSVGLIRW
jgi:hypothetical protein